MSVNIAVDAQPHAHSHTLTLTHSHSHTLTQTLTHTHTLTHSLTQTGRDRRIRSYDLVRGLLVQRAREFGHDSGDGALSTDA
jgi:hypothetical protein